jgi:hypothetical protein
MTLAALEAAGVIINVNGYYIYAPGNHQDVAEVAAHNASRAASGADTARASKEA